ncbi:hypothetical protein V1522DRAFT_390806 [Lipomyces starkeyi]
MDSTATYPLSIAASTTGVKIPVYTSSLGKRESSRISRLSIPWHLIEEDIPLSSMTTKELQADNIAKGVIIGHVNNSTMLTLTMFELAFDMFTFFHTRYTETNADRQVEVSAKLTRQS